MREIKFRAWDKRNKKMLYGVVNLQNAIDRGVELMQYTGLKDRNRKEIYEGDIVKCKRYVGSSELVDDGVAEIIFADGCFVAKGKHWYTLRANPVEYEVIGSIYENPELLAKP